LLPASPATHEGVRKRTHAVALRIEAADRQAAKEVTAVRDAPDKAAAADASQPTVMLDGAYIRAVPGYQVRHLEAIYGKVEQEGHCTRRFALVRSVAEQPHALLRAALQDQDWRERNVVTALSDGDPALPALVRSATGGPVEPILDWFYLSMRVHHVEQVMRGLFALAPPLAPLDPAQIDVERLRHLLWNGCHEKACEALGRIASWAKDAVVPNEPVAEAKARRLVARCAELRSYIENNEGPMVDDGQRHRAGKPSSTSRAESTVNQLACARMNKRRQMRWSPLRRPSRASGQARGAGRTFWPTRYPTRGVAPQVLDASGRAPPTWPFRDVAGAGSSAGGNASAMARTTDKSGVVTALLMMSLTSWRRWFPPLCQ